MSKKLKIKRIFRQCYYRGNPTLRFSFDDDETVLFDLSDGRTVEIRVGDDVALEDWYELGIFGKEETKKPGILRKIFGRKAAEEKK